MKADIQPGNAIMIGESHAIQEVREQIAALGPTTLSVLIQGETGSGKELVARALHQRSECSGLFVPVNVCAISVSMFEDSFFGHVRGAYTGAISDRLGYFAEADRGTIFLDEIGELELCAQSKLLRPLETHEFRPLGDRRDHRSDFRVVAATNQVIAQQVRGGLFRADLAFRLQDAVVHVPPLRERRQDVGLIAQHFASLPLPCGRRGAVSVSAEAIRKLEAYSWPGNVRELLQVIRRAVTFTEGSAIGAVQIERAWLCADSTTGPAKLDAFADGYGDLVGRRLIDALERNDWDALKVADELGVTRKTIYSRAARLGIVIPRRYRRRGVPADAALSETGVADVPRESHGEIVNIHREIVNIHRAANDPHGNEMIAPQ